MMPIDYKITIFPYTVPPKHNITLAHEHIVDMIIPKLMPELLHHFIIFNMITMSGSMSYLTFLWQLVVEKISSD